MERELTVRHVFVGFVEGKESGIRNPECGIRNSQPFQCHLLGAYCIVLYFIYEPKLNSHYYNYFTFNFTSRTGSTRTASPGRINSDRLGPTRIE